MDGDDKLMALSKVQEEKMYDMSLKTREDISWIRECLQDCDKVQITHGERLRDLEVEHSLLKGRLGAFILGLTFIISLIVNGILGAISYFAGK